MNIKLAILTCIIFVLASLNCYGAPLSVEQIISDEQIKKLFPYDIKDVPDDQKTIAREFEAFEKKSSDIQKFRDEFEKKFNIFYLAKATAKKVIKKEDPQVLDMLIEKFDDVLAEGGCALSTSAQFLILLSMTIGYPLLPLARSDAPLLHQKIEQLAIKFQIPKPLIFVCFSDACVGMYVSGEKGSSANVIVGYKTLMNCDDASLDVFLAHELGHVKLNHLVPLRSLLRMGVVAIPSYVLSYIVSNWLSKMSGYDDWKVKTPLFFSSNYIISHSLNKILSRLCGWTYFDCGREVEADQEALKLFGPEACIRSFQQLGYLYDKQIRAIYGEGVLSKDRLSDALKEGFTQKEKTDTLWHSMISLHNYDHPTMYQRIVAAAKIWAKKLTAIHAQAA